MDTVTMTFNNTNIFTWLMIIFGIITLLGLIGITITTHNKAKKVLSALTTLSVISLAAASMMASQTDEDIHDSQHPTTNEVAQRFNLTAIPNTESDYISDKGIRYTNCVAKTHIASKTSVTAKLFCLKNEQSISVPAPQ